MKLFCAIARQKNAGIAKATARLFNEVIAQKNKPEWASYLVTNPKQVEFDLFRNEAGYNHFVLSPQKWIGATNAIGLQSKSGYENFYQTYVKKVRHLPENPYWDGQFQLDDNGTEVLLLEREVRND